MNVRNIKNKKDLKDMKIMFKLEKRNRYDLLLILKEINRELNDFNIDSVDYIRDLLKDNSISKFDLYSLRRKESLKKLGKDVRSMRKIKYRIIEYFWGEDIGDLIYSLDNRDWKSVNNIIKFLKKRN